MGGEHGGVRFLVQRQAATSRVVDGYFAASAQRRHGFSSVAEASQESGSVGQHALAEGVDLLGEARRYGLICAGVVARREGFEAARLFRVVASEATAVATRAQRTAACSGNSKRSHRQARWQSAVIRQNAGDEELEYTILGCLAGSGHNATGQQVSLTVGRHYYADAATIFRKSLSRWASTPVSLGR